MFKIVAVTIALAFSMATSAQVENLPAAIKETFTHQYANAQDVVYKDNLLTPTVNFTVNGASLTAYYTRKGVWKYTEENYDFDHLPALVKDGFAKSKYAEWKKEDVRKLYRPGGTERFRLKVSKSDLQKKWLSFNNEGRLVEDDITL